MVNKKELLEAILEARLQVQMKDEELSCAKDVQNEAERKLAEIMETEDTKSFKIEGLATVTRTEILYVSVVKDDRDKLLLWADEECGRPDLIKRTIHGSTLKSFIGQRIKDGEPVPSFINQYYKPGLTIRRA